LFITCQWLRCLICYQVTSNRLVQQQKSKLCTGGSNFESWPEHDVSWLRATVVVSVFPGVAVLLCSWPVSSKSVLVCHHLPVSHPIIDTIGLWLEARRGRKINKINNYINVFIRNFCICGDKIEQSVQLLGYRMDGPVFDYW
jgi:hypothetical protein